MQDIATLADLDLKLEECRLAAAVSDQALRAVFQQFAGRFVLDHPADPFTDEYRQFQMALYQRFAQRPYALANEASSFDLPASVLRPFPYITGSPTTAGQHLGAVAFLLRCLRLPAGARVLEFGPGWGNTTIALAQLGFDVTAVDIDPGFCELLRRRADQAGVTLRVVNADFLWAEQVPAQATDPFDAVIFFECFHHCADHLRLLRALHGALRPDGRVYFGAEPIIADYPIPWGLRMDGEALWAIRNNGWLELGFRESYFRAALNRTGWIGRPTRSADLPWISVWEATAYTDALIAIDATDPRLGSITGRKTAAGIELAVSAEGYALYGPHIPLAAGTYRGVVRFVRGAPLHGRLVLDVCADRGITIFAAAEVDLTTAAATAEAGIEFDLPEQADEIELRLSAAAGATASIRQIAITRIAPPQGASAAGTAALAGGTASRAHRSRCVQYHPAARDCRCPI